MNQANGQTRATLEIFMRLNKNIAAYLFLFFTFNVNAFLSFGSSTDGTYSVDASKTISINKEMGIIISQKEIARIIGASKLSRLVFEGDIVTIYKKGEIVDGCTFDKQKWEIACKAHTFQITKDDEYFIAASNSLNYFLAIKKK